MLMRSALSVYHTRTNIVVAKTNKRSINSGVFLHQVNNNVAVKSKINEINDNPGARKKGRRIGRGPGSSKGKTAGRGTKGRKARSGGTHPLGFEGGHKPYYQTVQKFGFKNFRGKRTYQPLNLDRLQHWIDRGLIDPNKTITMKELVDSGCVGKLRNKNAGVKLLSEGREWFTSKVTLEVSQASARALAAVEAAGGSVSLFYYNKLGLRHIVYPHKFMRPIYYPPPPHKVNRKLFAPMEQPTQNPVFTGSVLEKDREELKHKSKYVRKDGTEEQEEHEEPQEQEAHEEPQEQKEPEEKKEQEAKKE